MWRGPGRADPGQEGATDLVAGVQAGFMLVADRGENKPVGTMGRDPYAQHAPKDPPGGGQQAEWSHRAAGYWEIAQRDQWRLKGQWGGALAVRGSGARAEAGGVVKGGKE